MFNTPWPTWTAWFITPVITIVMFIVVWLIEIRPYKDLDE